MSMLGARDNEQHSYLEIVDALRQFGCRPEQDMAELWRRVVFSVLISNTDDHLRNHGFVYERGLGWCLSPVYDVNPTPLDVKPRILTTLIDEHDGTASLELAFSVAPYFGLNKGKAAEIAKEVGLAVQQWRDVASQLGLRGQEINSMATAFEHEDLVKAIQSD